MICQSLSLPTASKTFNFPHWHTLCYMDSVNIRHLELLNKSRNERPNRNKTKNNNK